MVNSEASSVHGSGPSRTSRGQDWDPDHPPKQELWFLLSSEQQLLHQTVKEDLWLVVLLRIAVVS